MSIDDLELLIQRFSASSVSIGEIETLVHFCKDKDLVVELGTNIGTTAILLKAVAKRVCTVDVFENIDLIEDKEQRGLYLTSFQNNNHYFSKISEKLKPFGVEVYQGLSYRFAEKFNREEVDVVFIDADHSYHGVKRDYNAWFDKVKVKGYFVFHDCIPSFPCYEFVMSEMLHDSRASFELYIPEGKSSIMAFRKNETLS